MKKTGIVCVDDNVNIIHFAAVPNLSNQNKMHGKEMNYSNIYIYPYIDPALPQKRYDLSMVDQIRTWHESISMDHGSSHAIDTENSFVSLRVSKFPSIFLAN